MATNPSALSLESLSAEIERLKAEAPGVQPPPTPTPTPTAPTFTPYTAPDGARIESPEQLNNYLWQKDQQIAEATRIAAENAARVQATPQTPQTPAAESTAEDWAQLLVSKGPKAAIAKALGEMLGVDDPAAVIRAMAGATIENGKKLTDFEARSYGAARENAGAEFVSKYADEWDGSGDNPAKLYQIVRSLGLPDHAPASYEAAYHYGIAQKVFQRPGEQQPQFGGFSQPAYNAPPPRVGRGGSLSQNEQSIIDRAEDLPPEQLAKLMQQFFPSR